jgi:hypothetical protein
MATTPTPNDSSFWDDISQMLGTSAAGAGAGRASEANYLSARDRTNAELYNIAQTARTQAAGQDINRSTQALAADKYVSGLPGQGASEAIRGALMQNATAPTLNLGKSHITPISFDGGNSVDAFTPETRAAGATLAAHGTSLLNNPGSFAQGAMPSAATSGANQFLPTPTLSAMPSASFWEQAAGAGAVSSGLISALSKAAAGGNSSAANALKKIFGGGGGSSNPGGIDNSGNTEDSRVEAPNQYGPDPSTGPTDWWNYLPGAPGTGTPDQPGTDWANQLNGWQPVEPPPVVDDGSDYGS